MKPSGRWPRAGGPVELSYAKGSVREAAEELGIDSGRISKWRQRDNKAAPSGKSNTDLTDEQKQIRQLQKQLKAAQPERDILKKAVSIFSRSDRAADRGKYLHL